MNEYVKWWSSGAFGLTVFICALGLGCSNQPKEVSTSQPTVQDARDDSDRFFQKMEEVEQAQPSR